MNTPVIEFENVTFAYEGDRPILIDLSLKLEEKSFTLVKGPSGVGKSTFLRLVCRLNEPNSGTIRFQGEDLQSITPSALRRDICYVQQMPTLLPETVKKNLLLPFSFKINRDQKPPPDQKLKDMLGEFGLGKISLGHFAPDLSVGQKQRVCLLRAMLPGPRVMLLDEPTSALDEDSARVVMEKTEEIHVKKNVTVIMASHNFEPKNARVGRLLLQGGKQAVYHG